MGILLENWRENLRQYILNLGYDVDENNLITYEFNIIDTTTLTAGQRRSEMSIRHNDQYTISYIYIYMCIVAGRYDGTNNQ